MSKVNPSLKKTSKFEEERLAGGSGALAAKQSNVAFHLLLLYLLLYIANKV